MDQESHPDMSLQSEFLPGTHADQCDHRSPMEKVNMCKVLTNSINKSRGVIVSITGMTGKRRTRGRQPRLIGENRDYSSCLRDNEPDEGCGETNAGI
ncbi:hypothetical protein TNCV_125951 [Trichonephila clavipes]|nr:hypothetical protein TNCV_125951 [Trichonephila clavipes]